MYSVFWQIYQMESFAKIITKYSIYLFEEALDTRLKPISDENIP